MGFIDDAAKDVTRQLRSRDYEAAAQRLVHAAMEGRGSLADGVKELTKAAGRNGLTVSGDGKGKKK